MKKGKMFCSHFPLFVCFRKNIKNGIIVQGILTGQGKPEKRGEVRKIKNLS